MNARYKCIKCEFEWESPPHPTVCFRCGNIYVEWVNYEDMEDFWEESNKDNSGVITDE